MKVDITKKAKKDFAKVPLHIQNTVKQWVSLVERLGLPTVREHYKSYHDEPLTGKLFGYQSIRLNKKWRLIYHPQTRQLITIERITPHEYRH